MCTIVLLAILTDVDSLIVFFSQTVTISFPDIRCLGARSAGKLSIVLVSVKEFIGVKVTGTGINVVSTQIHIFRTSTVFRFY